MQYGAGNKPAGRVLVLVLFALALNGVTNSLGTARRERSANAACFNLMSNVGRVCSRVAAN